MNEKSSVSATPDEVIALAQALEQRRALQIVSDVHNLPIAGRGAIMPTAYQAGHCNACEEIEHRLRTEEWGLCLKPSDSAPVAATSGVWEPIESAPRSGLIDLWIDGRRYQDCYWDAICGEYRHITKEGTLIRLKAASHWMPAPAAPTVKDPTP
jgi:hypothetical protein